VHHSRRVFLFHDRLYAFAPVFQQDPTDMKTPTGLAAVIFALLCITVAGAAPRYKIATLGFDDPEHTFSFGSQISSAGVLNDAGQVIGSSVRISDSDTYWGQSAWLFDGAATINVGLTSPEYTRSDGRKVSSANNLNGAGQVAGTSERYFGDQLFGQSAWLYDGATTIDIGLTGPEHTRDDGYVNSVAFGLNEAGQVLGRSERFDSSNPGDTAWLYDGTTTIDVGLTGPEHTGGSGIKRSYPLALNEAGQVIGYSDHFNGGTYLGQSAFLYNGATTLDVGLVGPGYVYATEDYQHSEVMALNEAGQVAGYSQRFSGENALGYSAFLYDGATTTNISLAGTEHTRDDGSTDSQPVAINEAGQVSGVAKRYAGGSAELGQSVWLYDGGATVDVGLTGTEHTRGDAYKHSEAIALNDAGLVLGNSRRYSADAYFGQSAWLYDGATTIDIGLTGPEHTDGEGYKYSAAVAMNAAGQAIGFSTRYVDGFSSGQDAWLYDPVLGQTIPLRPWLSSDGYAYSEVNYLGDDGLVLGTYELYDEYDFPLGERAFYFTITDGVQDLGSLVVGGLEVNGWEFLELARTANNSGQILGFGRHTQSGGELPFLLTPVPEPSTNSLLLLASMTVAARKGRLVRHRCRGQIDRFGSLERSSFWSGRLWSPSRRRWRC
jgi:hypothetical protein